jgi:hypothetical protein
MALNPGKMIARDFTGKVESRLHYKDIHIVDRLQQRGGARQDSAAIFNVLASPR